MPILLTKEEWNRIVKWTNPNKEDPEVARQREYVAYLDKMSKEMTKSWPNSVENVNKRNEEMRRARINSHENANSKFYQRYIKLKKEEQERMMYSARDTIFKNKDAPKLLLSSVIESVILKEREEQVKFNKEFVGAYEREQNRLYDEKVMRQAKEWNQLQEEKKKMRFQFNKQHQKEILDQIKEIEDRNRKEYEEELRQQKMDIENANKEIDAIKEFEQKYKEDERKRIWRDNERSIKEVEQRRQEQAARDHMDDQLLEVLRNSSDKIEARRKTTEKGIREEKLRILEAITKRLQNNTAARDAKEQASLEKAVAEKNAIVEACHRAAAEKKARQNRERREAREQYLRDEAQRLQDEATMHQWGLMNRFKNQELYEEYQENLRKEKERKTKQYREDILRLGKEVADMKARELKEQRYFYGELAEQKFRDADNKLLTHSLALLEEARRNGRPTRPILKAIDRYCKMYRLYPMPDLPKSQQEHFKGYAPRDMSAPEPGYVEPSKPPPAKDPDTFGADDEDFEPGDKRDGLQDLVNTTGSKQTPKPKMPEKKPEEKPDDYKRQGRANGLQRKREPPEEIVLPPITVVTYPCKKLGVVSNVPLKKQQPPQCNCVVYGEI